ncbi:MAG: aminotransferase class I/II-fold pyridoxal phosphate-dependent enzyme [Microscillaceae bacterium]|nr:aminotransferase class I/II-fold pyridoxal phosphate-dependent enzyme [Microscillaceae bacterium]
MKTASRLEGIGEYYFSQKLREIDDLNKQGKDIINLGIGSPDLPPHASVIEALQQASSQPHTHAYQSYKGSPILRQAIANWYQKWYAVNLNPDTEILPLLGSKEGIMHICMTYLNEGDEVLIPNPGYPTYRSAVQLAGASCREYHLREENNWLPNFAEIESQDLRKVKLMWVNYPQMPTGQLPDNELFTQLIAFGKKHQILICHDNPYSFILNDKPMSLLQIAGAKEVALELNSLSKSHNMAGWRVGMLLGAKNRIEEVLRFKSNMDSGMFLPVQLAAAQALSLDKDWHESLNQIYQNRRELVFELLRILNCRFSPQQVGMFVWAKIPPVFTSGYELSDKILYENNVFITPGGIFGSAGDEFVRISLCASESKLQVAIARLLHE